MSVAPVNEEQRLVGLPGEEEDHDAVVEETGSKTKFLPPLNRTSEFNFRTRPQGQNISNPCICFAWLCGGTCSLRTGCYVVSPFLIVIGFVTFLEILAIPEEPVIADTIFGSILLILGSVKMQDEEILGMAIFTFAILFIVSGVSLLLAARWLNKAYARFATVALSLAAFFVMWMGILFTKVFNTLQDTEPNPDRRRAIRANAKIIMAIFWMAIILPMLIFTTYCALCAYGLLSQLVHDEYEGVIPKEYFTKPSKMVPPPPPSQPEQPPEEAQTDTAAVEENSKNEPAQTEAKTE